MFKSLAYITALLFWIIGIFMLFHRFPTEEHNIMSVPMGAAFIAIGTILLWCVVA